MSLELARYHWEGSQFWVLRNGLEKGRKRCNEKFEKEKKDVEEMLALQLYGYHCWDFIRFSRSHHAHKRTSLT